MSGDAKMAFVATCPGKPGYCACTPDDGHAQALDYVVEWLRSGLTVSRVTWVEATRGINAHIDARDAQDKEQPLAAPTCPPLRFELSPATLRALREDPTTRCEDPDVMHARIGWLLCALDIVIDTARRGHP